VSRNACEFYVCGCAEACSGCVRVRVDDSLMCLFYSVSCLQLDVVGNLASLDESAFDVHQGIRVLSPRVLSLPTWVMTLVVLVV
jgi:hypothetical protein